MRYWVVPHTHWDREWYLPFEHFRLHLGRRVDEVLDVLEADPAFTAFTLDGQTVALEDYLEVRPENEQRLRRLIEEGRLAIGPWYTLPDEYLVGPESLVRNLLLGRQVCERYGRPMAVGYLPDTFGHVAQMPQILAGFGLDNIVFWRGLGDEAERVGAAFRWLGPDGTDVLAIRILGGYGNADRLGGGHADLAASRIAYLTEHDGERYRLAGLDEMLLMNGTDHRPIQRGLPALLKACEELLPEASFAIGTVEGYVDRARPIVGPLEKVEGELCGGHDIAVLRGVNSARVELKQANEAAERELFAAEALASLALLRGARYPAGELRVAWRELLRNHAHDSIGGCSVDEVDRDMHRRFETARAVARVVERSAFAALEHEEPPWSNRPVATESSSIVNLLPWSRTRVVELELPRSLARARSLVAEVDGAQAPVQTSGRALVSLAVDGFSSRRLTLRPGRATGKGGARVVSERAIENELYRLEVAANGTLAVTDRTTSETVEGIHLLEDQADRGDEYNFCALEGEVPWTSRDSEARIRVLAHGPVVAELEVTLSPRLPLRLRADRKGRTRASVSSPVRTRIRLAAGIDRIEFRTAVENRALDHRLRVLFPAGRSIEEIRVEGHFAVVRRPPQPVWNGRWSEPPQTTHHTLGLVAAGRLALYTKGIQEYEALPHAGGSLDVALTLLRCVGWLSRNDLSNRFHHAGPPLETPGAQCLGEHRFEYALSLRGERSDGELVRAAHDYRHDLAVGPEDAGVRDVLGLEGEGFTLSALKQAEDGDGVIARVYNPCATATSVRVRGDVSVERCRLDEGGGEPLSGDLPLNPYEIATLRLRAGRP